MTWYEMSRIAAQCFLKVFINKIERGYGIGLLSFAISHSGDQWDRDVKTFNTNLLRHDQWEIIPVHEAFDATDLRSLDES